MKEKGVAESRTPTIEMGHRDTYRVVNEVTAQ